MNLQRLQQRHAARVLDPGTTYMTPLGRLCRWLRNGGADSSELQEAEFYYLPDSAEQGGGKDKFALTRRNWRLLTPVL